MWKDWRQGAHEGASLSLLTYAGVHPHRSRGSETRDLVANSVPHHGYKKLFVVHCSPMHSEQN